MAQLQNKRASSAARNIVFIAAVALLMAAGGVLLSFGGGGSWTATGEGGPSCGARVCPPCQDAPQIAEAQRQQQDLDASPEAELQNCPPPPDCPSAEPAEGRACPACIAPADCPPAAAAAAAATVDVADPAAAEAADLLCGGPDAIPSVADALDSANEAILAAANRSFAQWAETGFSLENLLTSAEVVGASGFHDTFVWVEVKNGSVTYPRRYKGICDWFCNMMVPVLAAGWERGIREGRLRVPEGMPFILNVFDYSGCHTNGDDPPGSICPGPVLSVIRHKDNHDVMVPLFTPLWEPHFEPWGSKSDLAFFRGSPWCSNHPLNGTVLLDNSTCSRESLTLLSDAHPGLLNVSLIRPYGRVTTPEGEPASHHQHASFKYLLQLDGITASRRFGTLMSINSLVLKQESPWSEWFYPALQPCVHYLPFWQTSEEDVLDLLRTLRANPANEITAQRIAANANAFAAAWLDDAGQFRYWQLLIDRYVQLYRGPGSPEALQAKQKAEERGRKISRVAIEAQDECNAKGRPDCWGYGLEKLEAALRQERAEARAAEEEAAAAEGHGAGPEAVAPDAGTGGAEANSQQGGSAAVDGSTEAAARISQGDGEATAAAAAAGAGEQGESNVETTADEEAAAGVQAEAGGEAHAEVAPAAGKAARARAVGLGQEAVAVGAAGDAARTAAHKSS